MTRRARKKHDQYPPSYHASHFPRNGADAGCAASRLRGARRERSRAFRFGCRGRCGLECGCCRAEHPACDARVRVKQSPGQVTRKCEAAAQPRASVSPHTALFRQRTTPHQHTQDIIHQLPSFQPNPPPSSTSYLSRSLPHMPLRLMGDGIDLLEHGVELLVGRGLAATTSVLSVSLASWRTRSNILCRAQHNLRQFRLVAHAEASTAPTLSSRRLLRYVLWRSWRAPFLSPICPPCMYTHQILRASDIACRELARPCPHTTPRQNHGQLSCAESQVPCSTSVCFGDHIVGGYGSHAMPARR